LDGLEGQKSVPIKVRFLGDQSVWGEKLELGTSSPHPQRQRVVGISKYLYLLQISNEIDYEIYNCYLSQTFIHFNL